MTLSTKSRKPRLVLVLGNEYFARKIVRSVNGRGRLRCVYFDTSGRRLHRLLFALCLPFASAVYSVSGSVVAGGALKMALLFKKKLRLHFIGSDVSEAVDAIKRKHADSTLMSRAKYAANAPWLVAELRESGLDSVFIPSIIDEKGFQPCPLPAKFSVLTYLGEGKEEFYGLKWIQFLASKCPDVPVTVVGSSKVSEALDFPNVTLRGWLPDIREELSRNTLLLRMTKHDGVSHMVVQALLMGRWVIRTNAHEGVQSCRTPEELVSMVERLKADFENGELSLNDAGRRWAVEHFDADTVVQDISSFIEN